MTACEWDDLAERLLQNKAYVIDPLPCRVPESGARRYLALERHWKETGFARELFTKFARILAKLCAYYDLYLRRDDAVTANAAPAALEEAVLSLLQGEAGYVQLLVNGRDALLTLDRDDFYLAVFGPDEDLQNLLCRLAESEGLFFWPGQ